MPPNVKRPLTFGLFLGLLCALRGTPGLAQGSLEIIQLRHRTVEQVIPILRPLVEPGGTLTGQSGQLIVRVSPRNLAELRAVLEAIDRPARRLVISVRFEDAGTAERGGVALTPSGARIVDSRATGSDRVDQRIQVLDGGRATIASGRSRPLQQRQVIRTPSGVVVQDTTTIQELATGFEVVPRVVGRNVQLEVAPQRETAGASPGSAQVQRATTMVSAPLGQWVEIGAADTSVARDARGIVSSSQARAAQSRRILVKVDEVPN